MNVVTRFREHATRYTQSASGAKLWRGYWRMNWFKRITRGSVDESIYKRILWMYISFFLLFYLTMVLSYSLLPEGILRGKHPVISNLTFSTQLWTSTLQIAGYNLIPVCLIIFSNLIAQKSRSISDRYVPIGYLALRIITIIYAMVLGTWSFDVITESFIFV